MTMTRDPLVAAASVSTWVDRARRRRTRRGGRIDGAHAHPVFELQVGDSSIDEVWYACPHCVTLLAYCEALANAVESRTIVDAARYRLDHLRVLVVGVPRSKLDRAPIALAAFHGALARVPFVQRPAPTPAQHATGTRQQHQAKELTS